MTHTKTAGMIAALSLSLLSACSGNSSTPTPQPTPGASATTYDAPDGLLYAPGRVGERKSVQVDGKALTYEVIDGLAVYQGDMILGKAADVAAAALKAKGSAASGHLGAQAVICDWDTITTGWGWFCGRWSGGVVPYSIQADWATPEENAMMRARIRAAINHWQDHTALSFRETTSGVRVNFRSSDGCSSSVGRQENLLGDPQSVNLSTGCTFGAVVHEIGHAIGLYHEQSRSDRGAFLTVNRANIQPGRENNFDVHASDGTDVGPYNYASIMHYGCGAFSVNGLPTLTPTAPGVTCADVGNRAGLSDGDILAAYHMYPASYAITSPTAGLSVPRNQNIPLAYRAADPVREAFITWYVDGGTMPVAHGNTTSLNPVAQHLGVGAHTLKARLEISGVTVQEQQTTFTVTNVAPSVTVTQPTAGRSFCTGENVIFRALAGDTDGTVPESSIRWADSSTTIGTGSQLAHAFTTPGTRTVTVTATDNDGATRTDSVTITVSTCTDTAPTPGITNPPDAPGSGPDLDVYPSTSDGNGVYLGITLTGTATDAEDGVVPDASMVWTTDRADLQPGGPGSGAQQIGTGRRPGVRLYSSCSYPRYGDHTITLTVTDSSGNTRSMSRLIRVNTLC